MKVQKPKTIYAIYCKETKRIYVGCCADFKERARQHFGELSRGVKTMRITRGERGKSPWQEDYDQYGRNAFEVYILEENVPWEKAEAREQHYILKYRANETAFGYNIRPARRSEVTIAPGSPPIPAGA